jgi:heme/copper-type cytochrome/quinol oxidase subunit 3
MLDQKIKHTDKIPFYEKMHASELIVYLLMGSSAILFTVLILISIFSKTGESLNISLYFLLSTMTLLFSSKYSFRIKHLFYREDWKSIRNSILILTLSGFVFILLQYLGWNEMKQNGSLSRFNDFFYLLCGLHVLHILLMVAYSAKVFGKYLRMSIDPIYALLMQANRFEIRKITLLSQCWLYLDVIWMMILLSLIL